jgi:hypothetical protein
LEQLLVAVAAASFSILHHNKFKKCVANVVADANGMSIEFFFAPSIFLFKIHFTMLSAARNVFLAHHKSKQ